MVDDYLYYLFIYLFNNILLLLTCFCFDFSQFFAIQNVEIVCRGCFVLILKLNTASDNNDDLWNMESCVRFC